MEGPIICADCGTVSTKSCPGARAGLLLDIFFCIFFNAPVEYGIWRRSRPRCPQCDSPKIMGLATPKGYETQCRFADAMFN
jgi:hypothetical protein